MSRMMGRDIPMAVGTPVSEPDMRETAAASMATSVPVPIARPMSASPWRRTTSPHATGPTIVYRVLDQQLSVEPIACSASAAPARPILVRPVGEGHSTLQLAPRTRDREDMARPRHRTFGWSLPIGRVAGIRISVHLTFFLLLALVAWAGTEPGGGGVVNAVAWLLALFACVVVHELAHSLLARRKGAKVRSITLLPIGGVSEIEQMPERWSDELAIAVVGPLASIGLAALAALLAALTGAHLLPVRLYEGSWLARLAWVNLLLGMFNLVPAFPLDGGRVLRAALERRRDLVTATRIAATVGRVLGSLMVLAGLLWDFWLVLIGIFVMIGAGQEQRATIVHARLRGLRVEQLMRRGVSTLDAHQPLSTFRGWWLSGPQIVTVDGRYAGLVDGDRLGVGDPHWTVGDITDREAPYLRPEEDIGQSALDRLTSSGYPLLAVVDGTAVVGTLSTHDVVDWLETTATHP